MKTLLIALIFSLTVSAQKAIELGECKILKIDSITLCSSHYSIILVNSVDTFTTVIPKSVVQDPIPHLTGKKRNIKASPIYSLPLNINSQLVTLNLTGAAVSHRVYNQYDQTRYIWKVRKNFWKKEEVILKLSHFYQDNEQLNLLITKIE